MQKKLWRWAFVVFAVLASTTVPARANHDTPRDPMEGLTEIQKSEMLLDAARKKEANQRAEAARKAAENKGGATVEIINKLPPAPQAEKLDAWAQVGVNLGRGLAQVAKDLGMAVNDFAKTPVGVLTTAIIVYKLMGRDIIHVGAGFLFIVVFGTTWIYIFRRACLIDQVQYKEEAREIIAGKFMRLRNKTVVYGSKFRDMDGGVFFIFLLAAVAIPAVGLYVMFS